MQVEDFPCRKASTGGGAGFNELVYFVNPGGSRGAGLDLLKERVALAAARGATGSIILILVGIGIGDDIANRPHGGFECRRRQPQQALTEG